MASPVGRFMEGINSGMSWAAEKQKLQLQQEQLQQRREQHKLQMEQFQIAKAQKLIETLDKARTLPPATGKALLKNFEKQYAQMGGSIDPTLSQSLFDPQMADTYAKASINIRNALASGDTEMASKIAAELSDAVGSENAVSLVQTVAKEEYGKQVADIQFQGRKELAESQQAAQAQRQQAQIASTEKVAGQRIAATEKARKKAAESNLRTKLAGYEKEFGEKLGDIEFIQKSKATGADDVALTKAFIRAFDKGVVTDKEDARILNSLGIVDRAGRFVKSFITGERLTPTQRAQMKATIKRKYPIILKQYKDVLRPFVDQIKEEGFNTNLMTDRQKQMFSSEFGGKPKKSEPVKKSDMGDKVMSRIQSLEARLGRKLTKQEAEKVKNALGVK